MIKYFLCVCAFLPSLWQLNAQSKENTKADKDSLISLLSAKSMELIEQEGRPVRKVTGPARFFHNNTYLLCDSAIWNVADSVIYADGNVKIIQNETVLSSDNLIYNIHANLAMFRGTLVQLQDKQGNTLRTNFLDYNTKDSLATFDKGASLKDKDGKLIESTEGKYESKLNLFTFSDNVEMFNDSVFINTNLLTYRTDSNYISLTGDVNVWREDNILSSDRGWYKKDKDLFCFIDNVHGMNKEKESWCDTMYYDKKSNGIELLGNVQVKDTTRNLDVIAGKIVYTDSVSSVLMTRNPVFVSLFQNKDGSRDSVWVRADTIKFYRKVKSKLDSSLIQNIEKRSAAMRSDPVSSLRKQARDEAEQRKKKQMEEDPEYKARRIGLKKKEKQDSSFHADSTAGMITPSGETGKKMNDVKKDTLKQSADDTLKIDFVEGIKNVRLYKKDMQILSNSLFYNGLDSLVRLYDNPLIWDGPDKQYSGDSVFIKKNESGIEKVSIMSEAYMIVKEDSLAYDQLRGAEMMAYFDTTGNLKRFDALGDASAIFYIKEDSTFATVNKSKSKILSASFKDGELAQVHYFNDIKNDAYPLAQMSEADKQLKGFNWKPELRLKSRHEIMDRELKQTQRDYYSMKNTSKFPYTEKYFPGYMESIYAGIEAGKRHREQEKERKEREKAMADSLSESKNIIRDSLSVSKDTAKTAPAAKDTSATSEKGKEIKKLSEREKKWAYLDSLDKVRAAEKEKARIEKIRAKKRKRLLKMHREAMKDRSLLEKYIEYYRKKRENE